jgi:hypothetical protein
MPVEQSFIEDNRILRLRVVAPYTLDQLFAELKKGHALLDTMPNKVHLLFDLRTAQGMPGGLLGAANRPDIGHPKTDQLVFLGANFMLKAFVGTLARAQNANNVHYFDREPEALAFLRKHDGR